MVRGGQDGELLADDEDTAADGDEDLTHDDKPDILIRTTEINHQALRKHVQRHRHEKQPSEIPRFANEEADAEEQEAGDDVEGGTDPAGLREGQIVDDLQEGGEVGCPAVVGDLVGYAEQTGADYGAVREEVDVEEGVAGGEGFVETEEHEDSEADDYHGDDVACFPAVGSRVGEGEGEEENRQTAGEENDSEC